MHVKLGGITLRIGFAAAAVMVCLVNAGAPGVYLAGFLSVLIHELTHLFFIVLFGCPSCGITVLPGGVRIDAPEFDSLTDQQAALCLLSAPAVNLLLGSLLRIFCRTSTVADPALINLTLGTVNLIPLSFLDGGRALDVLILSRLHGSSRRKTGSSIDLICLFLLGGIGVFLAFRGVYPVPYYLFFAYCVIAFLSSRKNHVAFCCSS